MTYQTVQNLLKIVCPAKDLFQTILSIYFKNSIDTSIKICSLFFLGSQDDGQTSLHTKRINLPLESYGQFNTNELSFGLIWGGGGSKVYCTYNRKDSCYTPRAGLLV